MTTPIAILDFEASCLPGQGRSFPIEVGVARVNDGVSRGWLIRPTDDWLTWTWDPRSQEIHGLDLAGLCEQGRPVEEVVPELLAFISGRALYSDNPGHERYWLQTLLAATGQSWDGPIWHIHTILEDLADGGLSGAAQIEDARAEASRRFPVMHRAERDARRLAEVIRILAGLDRP